MNTSKLKVSAYALLILCALFFITLIIALVLMYSLEWSYYLLGVPSSLLVLIIKQSHKLYKIYKDDR